MGVKVTISSQIWELSEVLPYAEVSDQSTEVKFLAASRGAASSSTMPRATSDRFSRAHQSSVKKSAKEVDDSGGVRNPIFNTERFGQHILKNPLVAQG